ncbi:MAG: alpha/beta hydrolase [Acidobacteriota bacterium]
MTAADAPNRTAPGGPGDRRRLRVAHDVRAGLATRARREESAAPRGTLLYVHGLGESSLGFEAVIGDDRLADWRHLAPDLPGYGKTAWPDASVDADGRSLAAHVEALVAWLDALGETAPVVVVGHSMGGVIAVMLAERHPTRVRAMVDVEGNVSLDDCGYSRRFGAYETVDALLPDAHAALLDDIYRMGVDDPAHRAYHVSLRLCDPRTLHRNSLDLVQQSSTERLEPAQTLARRRGALSTPLHYLYGAPRGTGARSRAMLDDAGVAYEAIDDAGHWPFLDQHDAFVAALARFLDSL